MEKFLAVDEACMTAFWPTPDFKEIILDSFGFCAEAIQFMRPQHPTSGSE